MNDKEIASFLREIKERTGGYYIVMNVDEENFVSYRIERYDVTLGKGDKIDGFYKGHHEAEYFLNAIMSSTLAKKGYDEEDHGKF